MKIIGFDIETVPQQNLSESQEEFLASKMEQALERTPNLDPYQQAELRRKIMGTSPYLGKIVCISLGEISGTKINTESYTGNEKQLLRNFWDMIGKIPNATWVSFNGLKFDVNFILMRSVYHRIIPTNKAFVNTIKYRKHPHFDVMQWMSDWGYPSPSLDIACDLCGVQTSKDGAIKAKDVAKAFEDGRIDEIAQYCEEDVRATLEVYLQVKNYVRD